MGIETYYGTEILIFRGYSKFTLAFLGGGARESLEEYRLLHPVRDAVCMMRERPAEFFSVIFKPPAMMVENIIPNSPAYMEDIDSDMNVKRNCKLPIPGPVYCGFIWIRDPWFSASQARKLMAQIQ